MNWKDKLANKSTAPVFDNDYIEKLASACEYAANNLDTAISTDITRNISYTPEVVYTQRQEISGSSDFLLGKLKEKIARRQEIFVANDQAQSAQVVQNILSRLARDKDVVKVVEDTSGTTGAPTETVQAVEEYDSQSRIDESVSQRRIDDVVALPHTSLTDVLEAVKNSANGAVAETHGMSTQGVHTGMNSGVHTAGETSTSQESPVKTAGARGKGPEAIGAAANRLRDKLLVGDRRV